MARFRFRRGTLALDFCATEGGRVQPRERLPDRAALAAWLREADLIAPGTPVDGADLAAAHRLRDAIGRSAAALVDGAAPGADDVAEINRAAAGATAATLVLDPDSLQARWSGAAPVTAALARVAADAIDLFARRRERLSRCALAGCGAIILSRSRGAARRWCSMATCGNVAKVAAHRARRQAPAPA